MTKQEKLEAQQKETELFDEIISYIIDNEINSYYELKIYAYRNRPDWIPIFRKRNDQRIFTMLTRECKRSRNKKYARPRREVMEDLAKAEAEFLHKIYERQAE